MKTKNTNGHFNVQNEHAHTRTIFGVVQSYDVERGVGLVNVDDPMGKCSCYALRAENGPYHVIPNGTGPKIGDYKMSAVVFAPKPMDTAVVQIFDHDGVLYLKRWSFARDWLKVKNEMEQSRRLRRLGPDKFMAALRKMVTNTNDAVKKSVAMPKRTAPRPFSTVVFQNHCTA
ncbi:MAG: hypothetical protein KGJ35_00335 [Patescibacteria group bacterium]|nr:hypothetical protein [Patescibacteria group bacterium]